MTLAGAQIDRNTKTLYQCGFVRSHSTWPVAKIWRISAHLRISGFPRRERILSHISGGYGIRFSPNSESSSLMPRINTMSEDNRPRPSVELESATAMPFGIRKSKRDDNKTTKSTSSTSTVKASGPNETQYLDEREKSAIENWNETVPKKATREKDVPEDQDPVIQAYLEAKLKLFRNASMKNIPESKSQDGRSVSSTQS